MINNRHFNLSRTEKEKKRGMYINAEEKYEREAGDGGPLRRNRRKSKVNGETHQDAQKELMLCATLFECLINT